jgi:hypothetical protein
MFTANVYGSHMDVAFEQEQLEKIKEMIAAYNDAISAFLTQADVQTYTLNTGQTTTTVSRTQLASLQATRRSLMNEYAVMCNRLHGDGTHNGAPAW